MIVSECPTAPATMLIRDPKRCVFVTPVPFLEPDELDRFAAACRELDPMTAKIHTVTWRGVNWLWGELGRSLYNHTLQPNEKSCLNGTGYQDGAWTAGSFHKSGVNALYVDGHVNFVRDSVGLEVWRALGSRNGKEVINESN